MSPINIIYKPVKKEDEIFECFFSLKIIFVLITTVEKISMIDIWKTVVVNLVTFIILKYKIC